jgi:uncharacterized protein (TIGR03435 family)
MSWFRLSAALPVALASAAALPAQIVLPAPGEARPAFEVATIKPSSRDLGNSFHVHIWRSDNSYRTENTTLRDLIRAAFQITPAQLIGGPDVQLDARWDVNAKIGDEEWARMQKLSSQDSGRALQLMAQALLADRFGLKFHTETRELPVFDLVVDKSGFKLQPAKPASSDPPDGQPKPGSTTINVGRLNASLHASDAGVAVLTDMLSRQPEADGRMVVDKTGLTGQYDWSLQWQPQHLSATASATANADDNGPSLFAALKEQLGLRVEPSKGPVQVLVVDAVATPTPN